MPSCVDRRTRAPLLVGDVERPQRPPWDAGGVDEDVERAELIDDAVDGGIGVGRPRDVARGSRARLRRPAGRSNAADAGATVAKPLGGRRARSRWRRPVTSATRPSVVAVHGAFLSRFLMAYADAVEFDPTRDYPLGRRRPDARDDALGPAPSGRDARRRCAQGRFDADDVRATAETIDRQAAVARAAGRMPLAENLLRAAELAAVPADTRARDLHSAAARAASTAAELEAWAGSSNASLRLAHGHVRPGGARGLRAARASGRR